MRGTLRNARNERITIQQQSSERDELNQVIGTWSDIATLWAYREALRGTEFIGDGSVQATHPVRWQVAPNFAITPAMRLLWRGQRFDIQNVVPAGNNTELVTVQGTGDGR